MRRLLNFISDARTKIVHSRARKEYKDYNDSGNENDLLNTLRSFANSDIATSHELEELRDLELQNDTTVHIDKLLEQAKTNAQQSFTPSIKQTTAIPAEVMKIESEPVIGNDAGGHNDAEITFDSLFVVTSQSPETLNDILMRMPDDATTQAKRKIDDVMWCAKLNAQQNGKDELDYLNEGLGDYFQSEEAELSAYEYAIHCMSILRGGKRGLNGVTWLKPEHTEEVRQLFVAQDALKSAESGQVLANEHLSNSVTETPNDSDVGSGNDGFDSSDHDGSDQKPVSTFNNNVSGVVISSKAEDVARGVSFLNGLKAMAAAQVKKAVDLFKSYTDVGTIQFLFAEVAEKFAFSEYAVDNSAEYDQEVVGQSYTSSSYLLVNDHEAAAGCNFEGANYDPDLAHAEDLLRYYDETQISSEVSEVGFHDESVYTTDELESLTNEFSETELDAESAWYTEATKHIEPTADVKSTEVSVHELDNVDPESSFATPEIDLTGSFTNIYERERERREKAVAVFKETCTLLNIEAPENLEAQVNALYDGQEKIELHTEKSRTIYSKRSTYSYGYEVISPEQALSNAKEMALRDPGAPKRIVIKYPDSKDEIQPEDFSEKNFKDMAMMHYVCKLQKVCLSEETEQAIQVFSGMGEIETSKGTFDFNQIYQEQKQVFDAFLVGEKENAMINKLFKLVPETYEDEANAVKLAERVLSETFETPPAVIQNTLELDLAG
jgi:hypothetical protein